MTKYWYVKGFKIDPLMFLFGLLAVAVGVMGATKTIHPALWGFLTGVCTLAAIGISLEARIPEMVVAYFVKLEFAGGDVPPEVSMIPLIHIRLPRGFGSLKGEEYMDVEAEIFPRTLRIGDGWLGSWEGLYDLPIQRNISPNQMLWLDHDGFLWIARQNDPINDPNKVEAGHIRLCNRL